MMTEIQVPEALRSITIRPLFSIQVHVQSPIAVGPTPAGDRRVGILTGGKFQGEKLNGTVLGGLDWQTVRSDGAWIMDVRAVLKTDDGALIDLVYKGIRSGPPGVIDRIARGEQVDPLSYYYRITPTFETASPAYDWLNRTMAIGAGHRLPEGPIYNIFEVM